MSPRKRNENIPNFDQLMIPTLEALKDLGGSGTIEEINEKASEIAQIKDEILQIPHDDSGLRSEVEYRLAWSRTYLKKFGLIENSSRGVWSLIDPDIEVSAFDKDKIVKAVRDRISKPYAKKNNYTHNGNEDEDIDSSTDWKEGLLKTLLDISPSAFERLAQRLLRESGFTQVEVTGKVGDGGIDGKGIVKISGVLSFHVIFQCKRYKGSISPNLIRDFRGAMQGRADKGLFITTGSFTREAVREATRDGAPPIDLIDGELLCEKLKELKLGVETKTKVIESVEINPDWFKKL